MPGEDFYLSDEQLADIARLMEKRIREGLAREGTEITCLPTYTPVDAIPESGRLLVMDLGGTNIRCAQVALEGGRLVFEKGPVSQKLLPGGKTSLSRQEFLSRLGAPFACLAPESPLPLGYCFSYPAIPDTDGDATLIRWTKELSVSDTVGHKVGEMLCRHLSAGSPAFVCRRVRVINDTVAALLAGMAAFRADAHIGLIVGTGTNMALPASPSRIPKIQPAAVGGGLLPVNLESGNFCPPHLTRLDDALDADSVNPGEQRFEKAASGRYLARLFQLRLPGADIDPAEGAAVLFDKAFGAAASSDAEKAVATAIIERSARLVAASVAGAIAVLSDWKRIQEVSVTAEGGVFWAHPAYREAAEAALQALLDGMGLGGLRFSFLSVEHANLLGSAIAGLSGGEEGE